MTIQPKLVCSHKKNGIHNNETSLLNDLNGICFPLCQFSSNDADEKNLKGMK
ncbi:hypothetical protein BH11BAC3_BH11BAC3_05810 [soil metagenome]